MPVTQTVPLDIWMSSPIAPLYVDNYVLSAGAAKSVTVPATADFMFISGSSGLGDYYLRTGGTAAIPVGDVTDGTGSFLRPMFLKVDSRTLSFISPNAGILTIAYFRTA